MTRQTSATFARGTPIRSEFEVLSKIEPMESKSAAVEAEKLTGYAVVYATSRYTHQLRYDLEPARKLIGYDPRDRWPDGAEEFD